MKQIKNILALLAVWGCTAASADEVKVVYMTTLTADGKQVETRLTDILDEDMPRYDVSEGTMKIGSVVYTRDKVRGVRFEVRMEESDAIGSVTADDEAAGDNNVYSVDGQLMRAGSTSVEGLPKGIYIINRKKIVVR